MQVRYQLRQRPVAPDDTTDPPSDRRLELDPANTERRPPQGTLDVSAGVVFSMAPQPLNCRWRSNWAS
jgi:hypothetical protein